MEQNKRKTRNVDDKCKKLIQDTTEVEMINDKVMKMNMG